MLMTGFYSYRIYFLGVTSMRDDERDSYNPLVIVKVSGGWRAVGSISKLPPNGGRGNGQKKWCGMVRR